MSKLIRSILAILVIGGVAGFFSLPTGAVGAENYFVIQVVDKATGRGVPLVELRTVNSIRYFTDSNGIVAFYEPGLMDTDVFFFVESHGYEFTKDGFGFNGIRLKTTPGANAVIKINRLNIAERLYRVTGQGIYRDSVLAGRQVPLADPVLNGQVIGQDSVFTCLYHGRLFWMWGDTGRPSYPLGNFAMSGAVSNLPEHGGLDPTVGVNLEYYVGQDGFSRPLCPLKEPGLVWLDGLFAVKDNHGQERMVAKYARLKSMTEVLERGLVVFNDQTQSFEPLVRSGVDFLPFSESGHAFSINVDGQKYYYFTAPSPVAVRMRVRVGWNDVIDANRYEVLTALELKKSSGRHAPRLDLGNSQTPYRWVRFGELIGDNASAKTAVIEALKQEVKGVHLHDIESDKEISPHAGTVYFNACRQRWVAIFVQQFGESSFLGEIWYAEADTPVGPWTYARKIVTHNKYSFYNPRHHPLFDQDGGRIIFFEGTYTFTFSGAAENATPRYDYNQIMYRLDLDDPRLALPVAVYQVNDGNNGTSYMLREGIEKADKWDSVEAIPFFAIPPNRVCTGLMAVYAVQIAISAGSPVRLQTDPAPQSEPEPVFYAISAEDDSSAARSSAVALLYEYRSDTTGELLYSTDPDLKKQGWSRSAKPLCRVWRNPIKRVILDRKAKPADYKR